MCKKTQLVICKAKLNRLTEQARDYVAFYDAVNGYSREGKVANFQGHRMHLSWKWGELCFLTQPFDWNSFGVLSIFFFWVGDVVS